MDKAILQAYQPSLPVIFLWEIWGNELLRGETWGENEPQLCNDSNVTASVRLQYIGQWARNDVEVKTFHGISSISG